MSLRSKLFLVLALALVVAAAVYVSVKEVGNFLVWRYYLNEESKQERAERYVEDFQSYVFENKLSSNDSEKIAQWSAGEYVDIILYKDSNLIYVPEWFEELEEESNGETESLSEEESAEESATEAEIATESVSMGIFKDDLYSGDRGFEAYLNEEARAEYREALERVLDGNQELRPVYFVDGTLLITVVDYTEEFVYSIVYVVGLISAFFVLAMIMILNFTATATRINRLAHNVKQVESGNLELPIRLEGNDELTSLANDVNSMRNTVIDNMTKQQQAWEANAELITAMSHDIRTPLTVMLGYLDLMELQEGDESRAEYIAACKENAWRLKRLSDDMFSYFLVFGKRETELASMEEVGCESIGHMLAERDLLMTEAGFEVRRRGEMPNATVRMDPIYFSRVMDNIFTNLVKYADQATPISVRVESDGQNLVITVRNRIKADESRAESNGIGNKTCVRIMEKMGGSFAAVADGEQYTVTLRIPFASAEKENGTFANT